jgi:hypothetical protein
MTTFSGPICISDRSVSRPRRKLLCSASPIVDCGSTEAPAPADPYTHVPARNGNPDDPAVFLAEVEKMIRSRSGILDGKGEQGPERGLCGDG